LRIGALDRRKVPDPNYNGPERRTGAVTLGRIRTIPEEVLVRRHFGLHPLSAIVDERHSEDALHLFKFRYLMDALAGQYKK
jgi:hypothetical protein